MKDIHIKLDATSEPASCVLSSSKAFASKNPVPCLVIQDIRRWRFGKDIPGDAGDVGGCGDCGDVGWDEVKFVEKIEL